MSYYKIYAVQLDAAFKEARTKYTEAYEAVKAAEKRVEDAKNETDSYFKGDADIYRADCAIALQKAKTAFAQAESKVWEDFNQQRTEIGKALESTHAKANQARPEDIDRDGLELLRSGILTTAELGAFLDRYENNPAMRRLTAQHIEKLLDDTKDAQARKELIAVRQKAGADNVLEAWKSLEDTARICSGQTHGKGDPSYVLAISGKWERMTEEAIESF